MNNFDRIQYAFKRLQEAYDLGQESGETAEKGGPEDALTEAAISEQNNEGKGNLGQKPTGQEDLEEAHRLNEGDEKSGGDKAQDLHRGEKKGDVFDDWYDFVKKDDS